MENQKNNSNLNQDEIAIFAAGCFWGVEKSFQTVPGVKITEVGYIGGISQNPTYEDVCTKSTNHAEAVRITYDPNTISYTDLVRFFWKLHDPTTLNRQGPDYGTQYRSAIFYLTKDQKTIALNIKQELEHEKKFNSPIVTEISEANRFYLAEEYHQHFAEKNPARYCHFLDYSKS